MMKYGVPIFALIFGFMTLKEGGGVLFFDGVARREAGAYVPFVLWFNFLTGFALIALGGTARGWDLNKEGVGWPTHSYGSRTLFAGINCLLNLRRGRWRS